jgi:hypothetical protein
MTHDRPDEAAMTPTPGLAALTIVGTLAYLGLAAFFSHLSRTALTIVLFALTGAALFSGGNLNPGAREDRANRWVIAAFGVIGLVAAYMPAYTECKGIWILDGDTVSRVSARRRGCCVTSSAASTRFTAAARGG